MFDVASSTGTSVLRITKDGNVGIGTTGPNGQLALNSGIAQASLLTYAANTSATWNQNILNGYYSPAGAPYTRYFDIAAVGRSDDGVYGASVIRFLTNPVTLNSAATEKMRIDGSGNIGVGTVDQFGGGAKVIGIANAATIPTTNPTGGGVLYCEAGALKYRGSSGTVTQLAPA